MHYLNNKIKKFDDEKLTNIAAGMREGHFGEYYFEPDELDILVNKEGYEITKPLETGSYKGACSVSKKLSNGKYRYVSTEEIVRVLRAYGKAENFFLE